ncbi:hypothetical protein FRC02_002886 [Tulasnella sp. 418]|nr:hypothetical protein FRC02_002886 [Tulasnella sp. 418]
MASPITPTIEIHPAIDEPMLHPVQISRSPFSPKFPSQLAHSDDSDDDDSSYRSNLLLPPPSSPVHRPIVKSAPVDKQGLDQERFEQLLQQSRERASQSFGGRKEPLELRKQVALKAHKSRALERRALFLSRIEALPSPTATKTPVTPPESPSVFHFSLPSPGLNSPISFRNQIEIVVSNEEGENKGGISAFKGAAHDELPIKKRETWIEEIDFKSRLRSTHAALTSPGPTDRAASFRQQRAVLPSLDQITARLASNAAERSKRETNSPPNESSCASNVRPSHRRTPSSSAPIVAAPSARPPIPLPAFLQRPRQPAAADLVARSPSPEPAKTSMTASVIQEASTDSRPVVILSSPPRRRANLPIPAAPRSSEPFSARPITTHLPYISPGTTAPACSPSSRSQKGRDMVEKLRRRSSAPADLPKKRDQHLIQALVGGF